MLGRTLVREDALLLAYLTASNPRFLVFLALVTAFVGGTVVALVNHIKRQADVYIVSALFVAGLIFLAWAATAAGSDTLHDGFDQAKIGEVYSVSVACGCNVCTHYYTKVSDTERRHTGVGTTTSLSCGVWIPVEKVR